MAKVGYDQFAGLHRLAEVTQKIDPRAAVVLAYHAALEREIDVVLARLLPHADKLRRFGYGHKIDVLAAAWRGSPDAGEVLYTCLFRFNELRNAVAHGDRVDLVEHKLTALLDAYRRVNSDLPEDIQVDAVAAGIIGFMGDDGVNAARLRLRISASEEVADQTPTGYDGAAN